MNIKKKIGGSSIEFIPESQGTPAAQGAFRMLVPWL